MPRLATASAARRAPSPEQTDCPPTSSSFVDATLTAWAAFVPAVAAALVDFNAHGDPRYRWVPGQTFATNALDSLVRDGVGGIAPAPNGNWIFVHPLRDRRGDPIGALVAEVRTEERDTAESRLAAIAPAAAAVIEAPLLERRLREADDALARTRERLRGVTDAVATGITILDPDGLVREVNTIAAEIIGMPVEEILGQPFARFIAAESLPSSMRRFEARMAGIEADPDTEVRLVRPDGQERLVRATGSPLLADNKVAGVVFSCRDITEERAMEVQIRRAERLSSLAPLLGGVCHELNNPLTSIKSFAELMLLDDRPTEDVEALEIIRREAGRAARIVTDLRLVARQTQDDGANTDLIRLNEVARNAADVVFGECEVSGISIELQLQKDLPDIYGSRPQIDRLVGQLLNNAVHALVDHDGDRTITVSTYASDLGVSLRVQDSGPGIREEDVERIFDPFWTTRTAGEGTGLGLSLAHSIVADHHGRMRVEGNYGLGAIFIIDLPTAHRRPANSSEPTVNQATRSPLRILIVDDEGAIRYSLGRYMSRRGHFVAEAEEGQAALDLIEADGVGKFDIILADLRMPGLNGEQFFRRLAARGDGYEEHLIFITGDAEGPDAANFVHEAGVPVVLKPFELAEIAQIIETQAGVVR